MTRPIPRTRNRHSSSGIRRGSAPLEMVLVAPILFFMFVLVIQVGNFFIGQAGVVVKARNEAWHERFTEAQSTDLEFSGDAGYVDAETTEERRISNLVRAFPNPRSSHRVIGDAWHARANDTLPAAREREEELNTNWNSEKQMDLGRLAGANSVDSLISQILKMENIGDVIENMVTQMISEKLGGASELLDELTSKGDEHQQNLEEQKNREREEQEQRIAVLDQQITAKKQEIEQQKARVAEIDRQIQASGDAEDDDPEKLTDEQIEALENEKKNIEEQVLPRLESELLAMEKERELRQGWLEELQ